MSLGSWPKSTSLNTKLIPLKGRISQTAYWILPQPIGRDVGEVSVLELALAGELAKVTWIYRESWASKAITADGYAT